MDALAGYSSDSSSSSTSVHDKDGSDNKKKSTTTNALSSVLAAINSDSDDDVNETKKENNDIKRVREDSIDSVAKRRKKIENQVFPSPVLKQKPSIVCWGKDYMKLCTTKTINSENHSTADISTTIMNESLLQKRIKKLESIANRLQTSSTTSSSSTCWADHLKNQHEFHNPHFLKVL